MKHIKILYITLKTKTKQHKYNRVEQINAKEIKN